MTAAEWIAAYASRLGLPAPSEAEVTELLALAGAAAHASERQAAPVCTWLAARAGLSPAEARQVAETLAADST